MKEFVIAVLNGLADLGYLGVALGLMIEVIPSEIVLAYGGFLVASGKIQFLGTVIAGTIGGVLAQLFLYWAGYYGGRPFLEKYGKYVLIQHKHLDISEKWFHRYGMGVIFGARFIPVVRHAISIPAGIAKMSFIRFTLFTTLAVLPWSAFFVYVGMKLGAHWDRIEEVFAPYVVPVSLIALGFILLYYLVKWNLKKRR